MDTLIVGGGLAGASVAYHLGTDALVLEQGEGAGGELTWSSTLQKGVLKLRAVAKNDPTTNQYQLWIVDGRREGPAVDGGVFDVTGGDVLIPIDAKLVIGEPSAFVITVEQPGGVVVSDRDRVVMTAQPN